MPTSYGSDIPRSSRRSREAVSAAAAAATSRGGRVLTLGALAVGLAAYLTGRTAGPLCRRTSCSNRTRCGI